MARVRVLSPSHVYVVGCTPSSLGPVLKMSQPGVSGYSTNGDSSTSRKNARVASGGPLIDTKTYGCEGATGSFYCRSSYEPLLRGTYTWRIAWTGRQAAHVELTVRW